MGVLPLQEPLMMRQTRPRGRPRGALNKASKLPSQSSTQREPSGFEYAEKGCQGGRPTKKARIIPSSKSSSAAPVRMSGKGKGQEEVASKDEDESVIVVPASGKKNVVWSIGTSSQRSIQSVSRCALLCG